MAWCRDPSRPNPMDAETSPDGRIVELSVSGAGFVATTHPYLDVGKLVAWERRLDEALAAARGAIEDKLKG